jgi:hypothetical protein
MDAPMSSDAAFLNQQKPRRDFSRENLVFLFYWGEKWSSAYCYVQGRKRFCDVITNLYRG